MCVFADYRRSYLAYDTYWEGGTPPGIILFHCRKETVRVVPVAKSTLPSMSPLSCGCSKTDTDLLWTKESKWVGQVEWSQIPNWFPVDCFLIQMYITKSIEFKHTSATVILL